MKNDNVVADMAKQRETAAARVLTIHDAISDAEWLRRSPDVYITVDSAKRIIDVLLSALQASPCYYKAAKYQIGTFVLLKNDRAAPAAIVAWAENAEERGCRQDKVNDAYRMAADWRAQPLSLTKWPD